MREISDAVVDGEITVHDASHDMLALDGSDDTPVDGRPADVAPPAADGGVADVRPDAPPQVPPDDLIDWVRIRAGEYLRGHEDEPRAQPVVWVDVPEFHISRTEVTVEQYEACLAAEACTHEARNQARCHNVDGYGALPAELLGPQQPAVCVTWDEAANFARWVSGRLPTEAEWEYAVRRARGMQPYPWGGAIPTCANTIMFQGGAGCGEDRTAPVCSRDDDGSIDGLCDVVGNVREWVEDFSQPDYSMSPVDGSANQIPSENRNRIVRGGSWRNGNAARFTLYHRSSADPKEGYDFVGFRVATGRRAP